MTSRSQSQLAVFYEPNLRSRRLNPAAYFIYVLLARYLERVMERDGPSGERAAARVKHILGGLIKAREELDSVKDVTVAGRSLLEALGVEVSGLLGRHPRFVA